MLRPIKRVWVPPTAAPDPSDTSALPTVKAPLTGGQVFTELPQTEVEERNSDSVWAEFESVYARAMANKANPA